MALDPAQSYVHLAPNGSSQILAGGEQFWSLPEGEAALYGRGWLISEFECSSDWANWEMHPGADEFVYLLCGSALLLLEQPEGVQTIPLEGRAAVVVPKGVWHTAKVLAPSRMLFVTMGAGTQHRPVAADAA
ncbi:cupin [Piscinibacter sp. XHJ-5]|uniref:cupin n=1 Tax=Piscinibacter sp. XHJ-5 TaxID=3037797 RepID=UPI002452A667|nr:cupin [Piscinibacter sp. XHJ-5]